MSWSGSPDCPPAARRSSATSCSSRTIPCRYGSRSAPIAGQRVPADPGLLVDQRGRAAAPRRTRSGPVLVISESRWVRFAAATAAALAASRASIAPTTTQQRGDPLPQRPLPAGFSSPATPGDQQHGDVVGERAAVGGLRPRRPARRAGSAGRSRSRRGRPRAGIGPSRRAGRRRRPVRPSISPSVYISSDQSPSPSSRSYARAGLGTMPSSRPRGAGHRCHPPAGEQQRRRVPGEPYRRPVRRQVQPDGRHGGEDLRLLALAHQHLLQRGQHRVVRHPGEHQRAPGDPQLDAERRLVDAVPADVADDEVAPGRARSGRRRRSRRRSDRAGGRAGRTACTGIRSVSISGCGQQAAFEPGRLGLAQLHLAQPPRRSRRRACAPPRSAGPGSAAPRRPGP